MIGEKGNGIHLDTKGKKGIKGKIPSNRYLSSRKRVMKVHLLDWS